MIDKVRQKLKGHSLWGYLASAVITLVSLAIVVRLVTQNLDTLRQVQNQFVWWPVALTLPVFILGLLAASLAWGKMMNDMTTPLPMRDHLVIFTVTHAARRLPGSLWHVVGRIAWYERLGVSKRVTAFANVLEYVLLLWSGFIMSVLLLPFISGIERGQFWLFLLGIGLSALIMHPRVLSWMLRRMGQAEAPENLNYRQVLVWLGLYLPIWLVGGTVLFLVLRSIYPVDLALWPVSVGAWCIAGVAGNLILVLPSGLGLSEATISLILATHIPSSIAVVAAILMRILLTVLELLFALIVFSLRNVTGTGHKDIKT